MSTDHPAAFSLLLRQHRLAHALTQEQLAERAGVSARVISEIERGGAHVPRQDTVALLATALALTGSGRARFVASARGRTPPAVRSTPAAPGAVPLVGRTQELALLERHLASAPIGPPLLLITGEPGIGKSRLLHEILRRAIPQGWAALQGGCQRRSGQDPFAPLSGVLAAYLRGRAPLQVRGDLQGCAWLARLLPELEEGLLEPLPTGRFSPFQEHRLIVTALQRFLGNVAGPAGTVLLLDDLQWAGADALDLLAGLLRCAGDIPLRVVGAYRDGETAAGDPLTSLLADLTQGELVTHHALGPLTTQETRLLLDSLLAESGGPEPAVREQVLRRTGGVPFFVIAYAHDLGTRPARGTGGQSIPWSIALSVRQRVVALPATAQLVLEVAAVAGRMVTPLVLVRVTGFPVEEVAAVLAAAQQARLLTAASGGLPGGVYQFTHDVIREVLEADVGAVGRASLHQRIAEALAHQPGVPPFAQVAYHFAQSEQHTSAAYWLEQAGDRARAGSASAAALAQYSAARHHLLAAGAEARLIAPIDEKLGDLCFVLGDYPAAHEWFRRAQDGATEPSRQVELWCKKGEIWHAQGKLEQALDAFDAAERREESQGRDGPAALTRLARIAISRGWVQITQGRADLAHAAVGRALALLEKEGTIAHTWRVQADAQELQGEVAIRQYDFARAEGHYRHGVALGTGRVDGTSTAKAWGRLGFIACMRGDFRAAEDNWRHSLTLVERLGDQAGVADAWINLGYVRFMRGDLAGGEEWVRRGLTLVDQMGNQTGAAAAWMWLGEIALARGDLTTASGHLRLARRLGLQVGSPEVEALATIFLAETRLYAGQVRTAAVGLARAHTQVVMGGLMLILPNVFIVAVELHLHQGALLAARQAAEELRRINARPQLPVAEGLALRLLGRCALAGGLLAEATGFLRQALTILDTSGACLEAARARVILAQALVAGSTGTIAGEARRLLAEAQAQFTASGATRDVAQAALIADAWARH